MFKKFTVLACTGFAILATPAQALQIGSANPANTITSSTPSSVVQINHRPNHGPRHGSRRAHCHRNAINHRGYRRLHRHVGPRCNVQRLRPRFRNDRRHNQRHHRNKDFCVMIGPIRYCE